MTEVCDPAATVPSSFFVERLGISDGLVRRLARQGIMVRTGRGDYRLWQSLAGYIRHLEDQAAGRKAADGDGDALDLVRERSLLARQQTEHIAMRNAAMRRDLVPIEPISAAVVSMIEVAKRNLMRVPARLFPEDPAQRKRVAAEIERALVDLSAQRAMQAK